MTLSFANAMIVQERFNMVTCIDTDRLKKMCTVLEHVHVTKYRIRSFLYYLICAFDNQENAYYLSRFKSVTCVSIMMPCDFRVWAQFCCGWHTWPRSHTTSLNIVQLSQNHSRRENTDQMHLPNL